MCSSEQIYTNLSTENCKQINTPKRWVGGAHQPRCSSRSAFGPLGIENFPAASCSQRFEKQRRRSQDCSTWSDEQLSSTNPNKVLPVGVLFFAFFCCNCEKILYLSRFMFCSGLHRIGNQNSVAQPLNVKCKDFIFCDINLISSFVLRHRRLGPPSNKATNHQCLEQHTATWPALKLSCH